MPTMKLSDASFLGRNFRRLGRFAAIAAAMVAGGLAFGIAYVATAITMGVWIPKLCGLAAVGATIGTYMAFDHFDLIPDDPDRPITLSLTRDTSSDEPKAWISSGTPSRQRPPNGRCCSGQRRATPSVATCYDIAYAPLPLSYGRSAG